MISYERCYHHIINVKRSDELALDGDVMIVSAQCARKERILRDVLSMDISGTIFAKILDSFGSACLLKYARIAKSVGKYC